MSFVVTGATGALGQHVVRHLLDRGVAASDILAGGRNPERLQELADLGVRTTHLDYEDPTTLDAAFTEGDRVLLISSSEVGQRLEQHRNAISAAERAGVALLVYTSILDAADSPVSLAVEHHATEQLLAASGVPHVLLRNGWYLENYTEQLATYLQMGTIAGAAGDGRIAGATRADYAEAAAAVLTGQGHEGRTYELGGAGFTMAELAAAITASTGTDVSYTDLPPDHYRGALLDAGLPEPVADMLVSADLGIAAGALDTDSTDLADLIGHAPTTMAEAVGATAGATAG